MNATKLSRGLKAAAAAAVLASIGGFASSANASVLFDLVATGGNGATVSNGGKTVTIDPNAANPTVTFQINAVFPNANSNQGDDGLTQAVGSLVGNFGGGGSVHGVLTGQNLAPFQGLGTSTGSAVVSGSDTNVGSDTAFGTAATDGTQFQADSTSGSPVLGPASTAGAFVELFGTATYTINKVTSAQGSSLVQYIAHTTAATGAASHIQQFESDGTQSFVNGSSALVGIGTPVTVSLTPEPGTLAVLGLGGMGLLLRRRRSC